LVAISTAINLLSGGIAFTKPSYPMGKAVTGLKDTCHVEFDEAHTLLPQTDSPQPLLKESSSSPQDPDKYGSQPSLHCVVHVVKEPGVPMVKAVSK
jgi:hypothetical protein